VGSTTRVLIVDDFELWRRFVCSTLQERSGFRVIGEAWSGVEAVQKAQELQPDLIVLDIGLPALNGIEVARQVRKVSPKSRILFLSENRSWDVAEEALRAGANGYVVKSAAKSEFMPAVQAALEGKQFVSINLMGHFITEPIAMHKETVPQRIGIARYHEAGFYSDETYFIADFKTFIAAALKARNSVIVIATDSHRDSLLKNLRAYDSDVHTAIEQGRYIPLDPAETLSTFMVNGLPNAERFSNIVTGLIASAAKRTNEEQARVAACGECAPLLWAQGNAEAAIQLEHLWDEIARSYDVDILCGYSPDSFHNSMGSDVLQQISAKHSAFHFR
jgi:DNA-binding NarL/FixJ family response regulator